MFNTIRFSVVVPVFILLFAGCQSHQAKIDALQREYDRLGLQFQRDCSAEKLDIPPKLSPKCTDEQARLKTAWDQLVAERLKK